jgi:hypothetical protein
MVIAERFGVLPSTVEKELDEWWFNRICTFMEGEALASREK